MRLHEIVMSNDFSGDLGCAESVGMDNFLRLFTKRFSIIKLVRDSNKIKLAAFRSNCFRVKIKFFPDFSSYSLLRPKKKRLFRFLEKNENKLCVASFL